MASFINKLKNKIFTIEKKPEKTFILGLGHQKCATSWLYEYLKKNRHFNAGIAKEYHIWDAKDIPILQQQFNTNKPTLIYKLKTLLSKNKIMRNWLYNTDDDYLICKNHIIKYKMQYGNYYFKYFKSLYGKTVNLSADITPSYSGLNITRLEFIKQNFAKKDISVKVVILIRDPLSRIKSAVKFNLNRQNYNEGIEQGETDFLSALRQYYKSEHCRLRTSYDKTVTNAYKVFGKQNVYVGIYEDMFELSNIELLSNFCGVPVFSEFSEIIVHKTDNRKDDLDLDLDLDLEIKDEYADVYQFCYEHFPNTKKLWNYSKNIDQNL